MSGVAFTVHNVGITAEQRDAGIAAMRGQFKAWDVRHALAQAGVPDTGTDARGRPEPNVIERAADRLMQSERRAGRIRAVNNRNWEALTTQEHPHA